MGHYPSFRCAPAIASSRVRSLRLAPIVICVVEGRITGSSIEGDVNLRLVELTRILEKLEMTLAVYSEQLGHRASHDLI